MQKPFCVHTSLTAQYEKFLGGGDSLGGATLELFGVVVPCSHTEIAEDYKLGGGGLSMTTMIEKCEFRAALMPQGVRPRKGQFCVLQVAPNGARFELQLWRGGLEPGGEIYRFELVARNYQG